ncbi:MAG: Ig-like domain-containing protein [Gammaproteobacteria bacterium]|nr:Ig-like domain-containing protein [Gammaproteobacteria bacterium]
MGSTARIASLVFALVTASCGGGGSSNAPPVAVNDGPFVVNSGDTLTVNGVGVLANDTDEDNDPLTALLISQPASGILDFRSDGSFLYTPNDSGTIQVSFSYKANDGSSDSNPATVTIDIDVPPTAHAGEDQTANVNVGVNLDATASSDPNVGEALSFQWTQIAGESVVISDTTSPTPSFTTPTTSQVLSFGLTVTDSRGQTDTDTVDVTVDVPPVAADTCERTDLDTVLNGDLTGLVTDPDSAMFVFAAVNPGPARGSVNVNPDGTFSYTPNLGERGPDSFTYAASDMAGNSDTGTVDVIVGDTRIMPLGDSITLGRLGNGNTDDSIQVAYRRQLYDDLTADLDTAYYFDFVGSQTAGEAATPPIPDPDHEGYAGFTPFQIATNVNAWLDANPADIVLLHIGTNDINDDPIGTAELRDGMIGDVDDILNGIDTWETALLPDTPRPVTVFLAQIIDRETDAGAFPNPRVQLFNNELVELAQDRITAGDSIVLVDQYNALSYPGDVEGDGVHPTPTGYDNMGDTWYIALDASALILGCPR